jgi:DNA-binding transcriptional LysR family regulator
MKQNFTVRQGALDGVEAFLSVAQHRSFRGAAAELGVTPSAISQAIRALEARVGAALFLRTTRSVGLTEAGERFLSRAKPAFEELVAARQLTRGGVTSHVTVEPFQHHFGILVEVVVALEPLVGSLDPKPASCPRRTAAVRLGRQAVTPGWA